jgi:hypothetical protein
LLLLEGTRIAALQTDKDRPDAVAADGEAVLRRHAGAVRGGVGGVGRQGRRRQLRVQLDALDHEVGLELLRRVGRMSQA